MYQIQQQIQSIRQDLQNISQVASQLQQAEQNTRVQLQQLQQNEAMALAQLQHLQQVIAHVSQGVNQINSLALQSAQTQTGMPYGTNWGAYGSAAPGTMMQGGTLSGQYSQPTTFASSGTYGPYSASGTFGQGAAGSAQFGQTGWSSGQFGTGQWGSGQFTQPAMGAYGSFSGAMYQPYRSQFEIGQLGGSSQFGSAAQGSVGNAGSQAGGLQSSAAGGTSTGGGYQGVSGSYQSQSTAGKM